MMVAIGLLSIIHLLRDPDRDNWLPHIDGSEVGAKLDSFTISLRLHLGFYVSINSIPSIFSTVIESLFLILEAILIS